jgi:hypothetical protein
MWAYGHIARLRSSQLYQFHVNQQLIYIYCTFKKNQLENSQDYCCRKSWREAASVAFVEVGNL